MASLSARDPEYVDFKRGMNTLRYRHAVCFSGQKLLHKVMIFLCENPGKIKESIRIALESNTRFKNCFTKMEVQELDNLPHRKWNLTLLFKVIQKICGLRKEGDNSWTQLVGGEETLEYLLTKLKNLRNLLAHNINEVIADDILPLRLDELQILANKIILALKEILKNRSKSVHIPELDKTASDIQEVVTEVKKMKVKIINPDETDSDSDMDDAHGSTAAAMPGQTPHVTSYEELFNDLLKDFWVLAGTRDSEF